MLMPLAHFHKVLDICSRPDTSLRTLLIAFRRIVRHAIAAEALSETELGVMIRQAKRQLPFAKARLADLEKLRRESIANRRQMLSAFGRWARDHHQQIEAELGWEGLCDILSVNPVHRSEIKRPERGLFAITWIGGWYEDSATHWGKWYQTGAGPITRAIEVCMQEWMLQNMDKLPDPFAPGGPFYGKPTYHRHPDGVMVRATPALTVHTGAKSAVVPSMPGRRRAQGDAVAAVYRLEPNMTRQE